MNLLEAMFQEIKRMSIVLALAVLSYGCNNGVGSTCSDFESTLSSLSYDKAMGKLKELELVDSIAATYQPDLIELRGKFQTLKGKEVTSQSEWADEVQSLLLEVDSKLLGWGDEEYLNARRVIVSDLIRSKVTDRCSRNQLIEQLEIDSYNDLIASVYSHRYQFSEIGAICLYDEQNRSFSLGIQAGNPERYTVQFNDYVRGGEPILLSKESDRYERYALPEDFRMGDSITGVIDFQQFSLGYIDTVSLPFTLRVPQN